MSLEVVSSGENGTQACSVDIVAVHGLFEGQNETWTDPKTGVFWLRDLLPQHLPSARVLTYGYEVDIWASDGGNSSDKILTHALNLVALLNADRDIAKALERPIIFICHCLGGLLVKRALAFCNTSRSKQVQHRRSIYTSSYAILFLGTPHNGLSTATLSHVAPIHPERPRVSRIVATLAKNSEVIQNINDDFVPLAKRFQTYYFWEQLESRFGDWMGYVVDEESAAPSSAYAERYGLRADHSQMCKFSDAKDNGFKVIFAALKRYIEKAPGIIQSRWGQDKALLRKELESEARELLRHDSDLLTADGYSDTRNEHFIVPRSASIMFTGRTDTARTVRQKFLTTTTQGRDHQHKIFVIYGLGGSGKTEFCLKFAEDNRENFWGIFWIDASTEKNAEAGFAYLGGLAKKDTTFESGKYWLSNCVKPWLLIIDNADDPELDISRFFPAGGRGHILVTTQNPGNVVHATAGEEHFREMEQEDAITLLLKAAHRPGPDDYKNVERREIARRIASTLGYLALALTHAGTTIRRNICTLEGYLPAYCQHRNTMLLPESSRSQYELTLITTWEVPYKRIEQRATMAANDAVDILHMVAFLHFENIPETLFRKAWDNSQMTQMSQYSHSSLPRRFWFQPGNTHDQNIPLILRQSGPTWDYERFRRALAVLSELSLIYHDSKKSICSMHPVVHAWARERLSAEDQRRWLHVTATVLSNSISPAFEASGRAYRRSLVPHIDACLAGNNSKVLRYSEDNVQASKVLKFASVYAECGRWKQARDIQQKVVDVKKRAFGADHDDCLDAMTALGDTFWNLSNFKECYEIRLRMHSARLKIKGAQHPLTLKAMDDLGRIYWLMGNRQKAKELGLEAVKGLEDALGPADPATIRAMHNLSCTLLHLGQPEKAQKLLASAFLIREGFFGPWHGDTIETEAELGMAHLSLGHLDDAERLSVDTLEKRTKILGEEHAYTLWSVNNVSKVYCARGRAAKAAEMLEDILPVVTRTLGNTHVGMSMTKFNLASAYIALGRWGDAEKMLREQFEIASPRHPDWVISASTLAQVCKHQGRLEEAEELLLKAIEVIRQTKAMGFDPEKTRGILSKLSEIYGEGGRSDEFERLSSRLEHGLNETLGP